MNAPPLDDNFADQLRQIIREEVRPIIREEVRPIVREETQSIRQDISAIRQVQGAHGLRLQAITAELGSIKSAMRSQVGETRQLGVLLEDLETRFSAAHE